MSGIRSIIDRPNKLVDSQCYHEFCRHIKSNFQLHELVMVDFYPEFIKELAQFSVSSLKSWQFSPNSVHFLLGFWQRLVASSPYLKSSPVVVTTCISMLFPRSFQPTSRRALKASKWLVFTNNKHVRTVFKCGTSSIRLLPVVAFSTIR